MTDAVKPEISFKLLNKIDVRVREILNVADVPDSQKLVRLTVPPVLAQPDTPVPNGTRAC